MDNETNRVLSVVMPAYNEAETILGIIDRVLARPETAELIVVEGQGSLLHPGSTATLPLLRGTMPTHMILCHRPCQTTLRDFSWLVIPPLREVASLYESVASLCGRFPAGRVAAISLNTAEYSDAEARAIIADIEQETGLPTTDPVRFGAAVLLDALGL